MILGFVMFEASTIAREGLGLKFKVGKGAGKGDGTWFTNQGPHGFPHCQGSFRVKVWGFWIGFGKLGLKASLLVREGLGLKFEASG